MLMFRLPNVPALLLMRRLIFVLSAALTSSGLAKQRQLPTLREADSVGMAKLLQRALLLPLGCGLVLAMASAQACEKHLRGHGSGSDTAAQANQP